jgi:DNA-binding XRE family transcriptional regulator
MQVPSFCCEEVWLAIPGYEGLYEASSEGRIRSLPRSRTRGHILKQKTNFGYALVDLSSGGKVKTKRVSRLVLEAHVSVCPRGTEACHGANGKSDNSLRNLVWGTHSENMGEHRVRDKATSRGERNGRAKLTWGEVCEIRKLIGEHQLLQKDIAEKFNVSKQTITLIKQGRNWSHPPEEW